MKRRFKLTYLTLGIGMGIVIASTLYTFYPQVRHEELSDDIIVERARQLGMISLKESINTEEIEKDIIEEETEEEAAAKDIVIEEDKYIEFIVERGENSYDIARNLFAFGLIDDEEEFEALAQEKMVDRKLKYGKYKIKTNSSYDTIIKVLTKENN